MRKLLKKAWVGIFAIFALPLALSLGVGSAHAAVKPSLSVVFSHDGSTGTAGFDNAGNIALNLGNGTYAQVAVDLNALGLSTAPTTAPSFTTDKYAAGSPRWDILLANGNYLFGFPSQLGGGALDDFTGPQWNAISGSGKSLNTGGAYESYKQALTDAGDILGNVKVTDAFVVEDADQAADTVDTLTNFQYDNETAVPPTPVPAPVTLSHGKGIFIAPTRENIQFSQSAAAWDKFTIVGPGFDHHVGWVHITAAGTVTGVITGLHYRHGYTVYVQPFDAINGKPIGAQGYVYFVA